MRYHCGGRKGAMNPVDRAVRMRHHFGGGKDAMNPKYYLGGRRQINRNKELVTYFSIFKSKGDFSVFVSVT